MKGMKTGKLFSMKLWEGGILADSMGVGKTLQALAPPPDDVSQDRKITLIVVPSALKLQWLKEIKKHAGPLKVMIYKASLKLELWQITDCDIMITSLRGRTESRKKKGNPEEDESTPIEEWIEQHREEGGLLHQIKFHRVILDESAALEVKHLKGLEKKLLALNSPEDITILNKKIIIFTQWRGFAAIAGRMLEEMGCQFVYFTGDKAPEKRNIAVNTFESDPNVNVMIAGLGCGGVGLNLAFANRVINIDLWWNVCLEQQAFGRVHRMPQQRETHFAKLIVNNTIDSRIYEKQLDKQSIIDPKMKKLTKYEMASLLGKVVTDENGRKRVVSDYDDEKDEHSAGNGHDNDDDIPIYDLGSDSDDEDYREL
ncbi:putative Uncharacterized ATP-dependent helicase C23E6.02 [Glarea lozoyensis 74030]|uniref:Putative Uncharacterized ATP-dependent helicase C23E6.02 n=1 Tax=Glarea lozoyensis (strain ATCC 74030 / MF5533) TaxID=1104152 RepID=H0EUU4_GLAL7|nr:putative Uncharacterized ATP-dependent helicase C23E6.02 [Glarea lozoyensis 74030]